MNFGGIPTVTSELKPAMKPHFERFNGELVHTKERGKGTNADTSVVYSQGF